MKKNENLKTFMFGLLIFAIVGVAVFLIGYTIDAIKAYSGKNETASENRNYYDGYDTGFNEGYSRGCDDGYILGYDEGFDAITSAKESAEHYAFQKSGLSPDEALDIIGNYDFTKSSFESGERTSSEAYSDFEAYRNYLEEKYGESAPAEEDYNAAVQSLFYFYEYYYERNYEELKE